jgi:hypothetical protein
MMITILQQKVVITLVLAAALSLLCIEIEVSITHPQIAYAFEGNCCWKQWHQDSYGNWHWYWDCSC